MRPTQEPIGPKLKQLDDRSRMIFREIVDAFVASGEPVGSRTLSRRPQVDLSPASIRNVMADLEELGLLYAPHTSAGRLPTERGLRLFVDGMLQLGGPGEEDRALIEERCQATGRSVEDLLGETSRQLSQLSQGAGLVLSPKTSAPIKHVEFVGMGQRRVLVILVTEDGVVENRVIEVEGEPDRSSLEKASNFLSARARGRAIEEAREDILAELAKAKAELDGLTAKLIAAGIDNVGAMVKAGAHLIVRGGAKLLEGVHEPGDLDRIRGLLEALDEQGTVLRLLDLTANAQGVQIFIGSENNLFDMAGCTLIVAPYGSSTGRLLGVIGVIGPTRLNYARVIPTVDYTAKLIGKLIS